MEIDTSAQDGLFIKSKTSIGNDSGINMDDSGHEQMFNGNNYTSDDLSLTSSPTSCHSDSQKDWDHVEDKALTTCEVTDNDDTNTTQILTVVSSDSVDDVLSGDEEVVTEDVIMPAFSAPRRPPPPADTSFLNEDKTEQISPLDYEPTETQPDEAEDLPADVDEVEEDREEAAEDAIVPEVKLGKKCPVEITVTDYSDEEVDQQQQQQQEPIEEEPEEEPEPEVPAVEYPRGLVCEDVWTALEILKTRYKLSEIQSKKCVITLDSPWWHTQEAAEHDAVDEAPIRREIKGDVQSSPAMGDMEKRISKKEQEIEYLLKQVLDEEKRQKEEAEKKKQEEEAEVIEEAPKEEPVPDKKSKRKRGNVFQRMILAIRKRLDRRNQA